MNKLAKLVLKEMQKQAFDDTLERAINTLETKYSDTLFSAWDNEEISLVDTIKGLLVKENIKLSDEDINKIESYFNIYFM